jgi:hypothetical protein
MSKAVENYLDRVMAYANRRDEEAQRIRAEQHDHLMEKFERLKKQGIPPEDAVFQAIQEYGDARTIGYRLRPKFPLVDIRTYGTARGVIAIGPRAVGVFAFGGVAVGLVAFGGLAAGLLSMGGIALGLLFVWAGMGMGGFAYCGIAIGLIATGGIAAGVVASGALAIGAWVPAAGQAFSHFTTETAPAWMRQLDSFIVSPQLYIKMTLIGLPILMLTIIVPTWLQRRENRRIVNAAASVA